MQNLMIYIAVYLVFICIIIAKIWKIHDFLSPQPEIK